MNKRELKYYVLIVGLVGAYIYIINNVVEMPAFNNAVTNVIALISAVTFWMQLKRTENLNEANYIMNLNYHFLNNGRIIDVEKALTIYYAKGREVGGYKDVKLGLKLELEENDRQSLINYLVYLEAMAAIMQRGVMHLDLVDDLFAYRFFIAINNPEVQEVELKPYKAYYQGCYALAEAWTKRMRKQGWEIPLDDTALCDTVEAKSLHKSFLQKIVRFGKKNVARMSKASN